MKVAICDDEIMFIKQLRTLIEEYCLQSNNEICVYEFTCLELLNQNKDKFDLIFLDICFNGEITGIQWAKKLREDGNDTLIVFYSSLKEQIIHGYEADAIRFLLKPVTKEDLTVVLDACFNATKAQNIKILIKTITSDTVFVSLSNILYIKHKKPLSYLYLSDNQALAAYLPLKEILEQLTSRQKYTTFFQVQKSYIVNLEQIYRLNSKYIEMNDGSHIPIARGTHQKLLMSITNYIGDL